MSHSVPADSTSDAVALADTVSDLLYGIAGWLTICLGLLVTLVPPQIVAEMGITAQSVLLSLVMFGFAFVLVALGAFVNPRFRRRLDRRHSASTFGRVNSVDQRVVRPEERCTERCVACGDRVEKGLVRRYREEYAIAGVPVYTSAEGYNHYCLECASREFLGERSADPSGELPTAAGGERSEDG